MAQWTVEESSARVERSIITSMIVSDECLRSVALNYQQRYFSSPFTRTISQWIIEHHEKYKCAPGRQIQSTYEAHRRAGLEPDIAALIGKFLTDISNEFSQSEEQFNAQFYIDAAENYFLERSLVLLNEDLEDMIASGDFIRAQAAVATYRQPGTSIALGAEPLADMETVRSAFTVNDDLLTLPGDLGKLIGPFERDTFWGLAGAFKAGKTRLCTYIALQALYKGLNVAWFSLEMGKKRTVRLFMQGICAMPLRQPPDGRLLWPVWDCVLNQMNDCRMAQRTNYAVLPLDDKQRPIYSEAPPDYRPCSACIGQPAYRPESWLEWRECAQLTWRLAWRKAEALQAHLMGARLKIQCWPRFSAKLSQVESCLQVWEHMEGFVPDLVVIDSPDILSDAGKDRHALNETRQRVAGMAEAKHCLLLAPFQAGGKEAMERATHKRSDVGEDARLLGHVDGLIHLNRSERETFFHRARAMVSTHRDAEASTSNQVVILQQMACGQAVLGSYFLREKV